MTKLTSINWKFLKKKKTLFLVTGVVLGISFTSGAINSKKEINPYYKNQDESFSEAADYIWRRIIPEHTITEIFTYLPSDIYKFRAFKGESMKSHYRIEIMGEHHIVVENSNWQEIPADGLITINRNDYSVDNRYGKYIYIHYGTYNEKLGTIIEEEGLWDYLNEIRCVVYADDNLEEVQKANMIRNTMIEEYKKIIDENDTDFDKVKKAYNFVIDYTQYYRIKNPLDDYEYYIDDKGIYHTDCAGYTDFINAILNSVDIESFTVVCEGHIWNIVNIDGSYYHLDATYSDTGSFTHTSRYRYFLVSDNFMQEEKRWFIKEKDVECNENYDLGFGNYLRYIP